MTPLPIDKHLDRIRSVLEKHPAAEIQAPPGSGKTTRVPLALLDQAWLGDKKSCCWNRGGWPRFPAPAIWQENLGRTRDRP